MQQSLNAKLTKCKNCGNPTTFGNAITGRKLMGLCGGCWRQVKTDTDHVRTYISPLTHGSQLNDNPHLDDESERDIMEIIDEDGCYPWEYFEPREREEFEKT